MGGSSGGGPSRIPDVKGLIERAKSELRGKRNVFISFSHEDLGEVNLLRGQAKNENSPLEFNDWSVSEPYNSERAQYIKQQISERINQSSVTVVYVTPKSAASEWVSWEIARSLELGKKVIGVYKGDSPSAEVPKLKEYGCKVVAWKSLSSEIAKL
jgi:hypothetical protein